MYTPVAIAAAIEALNLSPYLLIAALAVFYILLGFFLDGISIIVMSLPITLPVVIAAGFDPIWYGIFLVIMIELGHMTPPVGFNLFVIQGFSGVPIHKVAAYAVPFFLLMCFAVLLMVIFPQIALWLPEALSR